MEGTSEWRSELGFDGFFDFVVGDDAGDAFDLFAIARDEDAGGVAEEAAKFVGGGIVANENGILHQHFLAVDVPLFVGDERRDDRFAFFVHGDTENGEAFVGIFLLDVDKPGNFDTAGITPRGPEIDEDDFALVVGEGDVFVVDVFQSEIGSGFQGSVVRGGLTGGGFRGEASVFVGKKTGYYGEGEGRASYEHDFSTLGGSDGGPVFREEIEKDGQDDGANSEAEPKFVITGGERCFERANEGIEEAEFAGEPGKFIEKYEAADEEEQSAAEKLHDMKIFAEIFVEGHELTDAESGEKKGNGEASGIYGEEKHAAADFIAGSSDSKNRGEDRADAGRPAKGKREAEEESAERARFGDRTLEANVAIEPTRQRGAEKSDDGEREEVDGAKIGKERCVAGKRKCAETDEQNAEDDADAGAELDEDAEEMKAEKKNERASDWSERAAIFLEESADGAGRGTKGYEDDGEAEYKSERGRKEAGAGDFPLAELLHADAGKHGDVAGNEGKYAGRQERDQPGEKSSSKRDVGHS
jgi:hypothetical protein